ncbi:FAD-dependent monooxygenase [Nonomuraea sp. NPDC050556]|uniref:FAD-dependent monooxygenase n=1 Tax=Nonomuraea sp. NPDC050556 TaxID=3364369 RepID=UPI003788208C
MKNILISGASIAGPALAYWLTHHGFSVTVVERAPTVRDGGQALDFRGPAHLGVLEKMGILDEIRAHQTGGGRVSIVDADGRQISSLPSEIMSGDVEIHRGDLAKLMYEATKDSTEYLFNDSISTLEETATGVEVTLENGGARTFDLVIGADGLHSNVRKLTFGDEKQFRHDLGFYVAIYSLASPVPNAMYSVPGRTASVFGNKGVFYFASDPIDYDYRDVEQQREILAEVFEGVDGWQVPELMRQMWLAPDFYFDSVSQIRMDTFHKGRVALIGDAGYGASLGGMGTGLSVVGAYVLAGELARADGDHETAFARHDEIMKPYVRACQKMGEGGVDFLAPATKGKLRMRNLMWKSLPYLPWKGMFSKMGLKAATAVELSDY